MKDFRFFTSFSGLILFAAFLLPYAVFFWRFGWTSDISLTEVRWALQNSVLQAGGAAAVVMLMAVPMSFGLLQLSEKLRRACEKLLILPQVLPVFYSLLIAFSLWKPFPMGSVGVIFVFILINTGFAALLTLRATQNNMGRLALISEIYGVGRWRFLHSVYFPLMWRDLSVVFFIIFTFCISSFSVPLIAGGGRGINLEVLIYEKIFVEQNWNAAFVLSVLQTGIVFLLSFLVFRRQAEPVESFQSSAYIKAWPGLILILIYLGIYTLGYISGVLSALKFIPFLFLYVWDLMAAVSFTLKALLLCLLVNFFMLIGWVWHFIYHGRFNPAVHLISLSTVVTGFAIYLLFPANARYDMIKVTLGITLLLFPPLFRFFLQGPIENLRPQIDVARIYGLNPLTIIIEVVFRQLRVPLMTWASFLTLWFAGDFAVMKALGIQSQTLGLLSAGFLSSYRMPLSYLMSVNILLFWLGAMGLVYVGVRIGYVIYKKISF